MGVSGGNGVFRRFREACSKWPLARSTSARDGKGAVVFATTDEVLTLVYRPNLSVREVCTEAALKVNISPVALDFFTLVSEDGCCYLSPDKILYEADCCQVYQFKLCIKACHGDELREFDKEAFEYYFHQCREDFLRGKIGEFGENYQNDFAKVVLYEIVYLARTKGYTTKFVIDNPGRCGIKCLFKRGIFGEYQIDETKNFLKGHVQAYEVLKDDLVKSGYIQSLEMAEDFFVYKLSFEKIYLIENVTSKRKFEVLVSAEFGIKKRRTDVEKSLPEDIVKEFSEVAELEFDPMRNQITIFRKNSGPEMLIASSPQVAYSLITLIQGYYSLMINQYKHLLRGSKRTDGLLCHGPISREKAENLLQKETKDDGSFLLRRRRKDHYSYVLSVFYAKEVKHYIITKNTSAQPATYHLESDQTKGFSSLAGLIAHYKQSAHGLPVCLTKTCLPKTEGLAALLDREILTPAPPDFQLVDAFDKISEEDLIIEPEALSKGEFGEVRKGSWWCSNAEGLVPVASRALVKPVGREKIVEYRKAMKTFLELKNQHLTQFHGITEMRKALIFVFELAAEGPLDGYIRKESTKQSGITKGRVVSYAAQIAEGMMFLHSQECVHGRLSAHNVLVASEECVKISDYGLLHLVEKKQSFHASRKGYGYSYCWFAPLSLQDDTFDRKSDVWSFGVTLWEMFVMKRPFHCNLQEQVLTKKEVMSRYLQGQYLNPDRPNVPVKLRELIKKCFAPEPQDRLPFQELVIKLRSSELVPENEAEEVLLPPDINELEDWENPMLPRENELELQKRRADSQVSNADYSCLPGNELPDNSSNYDDTLKIAGTRLMPSISLFNSSTLRKQSLTKTFSHPGLAQYSFETDGNVPSKGPVNALRLRKPSITRASSCPPVIEATREEQQDRSQQLTTEPVARHEEASYVQAPTSSLRDSNQTTTVDVQLPFPLLPTQLELHGLDIVGDNAVNAGSEELDDSVDTSSGDDDDLHNTEVCAEAMAMMSLAGLVRGSVMPPPSSADDIYPSDEESNEKLPGCSLSASTSLNTTVMSHAGLVSGYENHPSGAADANEESNKQLSECGSSSFSKIYTATSTGQSSQMAHPPDEESRKFSSGSYVTLHAPPPGGMPQVQLEGSKPLNTADDSLALAVSPYRPLVNIRATSDSQNADQHLSANEVDVNSHSHHMETSPYQSHAELVNIRATSHSQNAERHLSANEMDVTSHSQHMETSPYQSHAELENASPRFHCKSADELLASFSNVPQQNGVGSFDLAEFLSGGHNAQDGPHNEESSPVISDLQDSSDSDDTDSSSREDAELSLGKMFNSGFNRRLKDDNVEKDGALNFPVDAFSSYLVFDSETPEQPQSVLEDDSPLHANKPNTSQDSVDNNKLSMGFLGSEIGVVNNDDHELESSLPGDSQDVFSIDHEAFPSNIAQDNSAPTMPPFHDNEQEMSEDRDTIDDTLGLPSGPVRFSPGKANFLNSSILMFDQGHESIEMNDLSKDCLSAELLSFKDIQSVNQEMSSNQLDDAVSEDGCSQDDEQEAEDVIEGNVSASSPPYSFKAGVDGSLQEITKTTPEMPNGGGYIRKEVQPGNNGNVASGYRPTPQPTEQELEASLSRCSSSEGIWPSCETTDGFVKRKSTIGSSTSWGEQSAIIQLDMDKIPSKLQIPHEQLRLEGFLGQGQFGKVMKASVVYTDCWKTPRRENVAVKVLKPDASQQSSSDFIKEVQNMVELASKQECRNIIKLRGVCKDPQGKLMLVTELAPYGALYHYLPENKDILGIPQLLQFCMQICKGMRYLEDQSLLHRDLSARNILVMSEDRVKISDFGLSRLQDYYKLQETKEARLLPVKWYALESLLQGRFTTKSDVWSFGVTMWEIFSYIQTPYGQIESSELIKFLADGKRLVCPEKCPAEVFEVMQSCWLEDPKKRPSFYLLETKYLKSCCSNLHGNCY